MPGELRPPCTSRLGPPSWAGRALGPAPPVSDVWQLTQAWRPEAEREASLKILRPRAAWVLSEATGVGGAALLSEVPPPPQALSRVAARSASALPARERGRTWEDMGF